jgi:hypothetical protein
MVVRFKRGVGCGVFGAGVGVGGIRDTVFFLSSGIILVVVFQSYATVNLFPQY